MPLEDRVCEARHVAVTVVDGDAGKTPLRAPFRRGGRQTPMHFVEADEIDARTTQPAHDIVEKARPYFEQPVGLKTVRPGRAHMMQRQDDAEPTDERTHQVMGRAEIERLETAANDGFLQRTQGHIPDLRSGNTPKSLLIIVCRP